MGLVPNRTHCLVLQCAVFYTLQEVGGGDKVSPGMDRNQSVLRQMLRVLCGLAV